MIGPSKPGTSLGCSEAGSPSVSSAPTAIPALASPASAKAITPRRRPFIPPILPRSGEGFLKGLLVALWVAAARPALADELLVGAVRDQDGAIVAGAPVTAFDAAGTAIGRDRTAPDGTFALAVPVRPAAVVVEAAYAEPVRVVPPAGDRPLLVVVRHRRAADLAPSPADLAAVPSGALPALASLAVYHVAYPGSISERYLGRGRGSVLVEGLPFYRRSDGADASLLLPPHATGALQLDPPSLAPWYGDRAIGGIVDARLVDGVDAGRATDRDLSVRGGSAVRGAAATSWDDDGSRFVGAARATFAAGPFRAETVAVAGDAPRTRYGGGGATLRLATQRNDLALTAQLTGDDGNVGASDAHGTVAAFALDAAGRGPNALALRVRLRDENGSIAGDASAHRDAALVIGVTRGDAVRVGASLALAYGRDHTLELGSFEAGALLPTLTVDAALGERWSGHLGFVEGTLGTPGTALARGTLGEASIRYADRRRFVGELIAYAEGDAAPRASTRGVAAAVGWELAPRLSLRSWILGDGDTVDAVGYPYAAVPLAAQQRVIRRQTAWLTWDAPVRVDLLLRAGSLEGGFRAPLGERFALAVDAGRSVNGGRLVSVGLTFRK